MKLFLPSLTTCRSIGALLLGLLLTSQPGHAQAPAWQTAVNTNLATVLTSTTDASGNAYVAGTFYGTTTVGTTSLTSAGGADVFVAKYSPSGGFAWAVRAGGTGNETPTGLAVSGGSVYVVGNFDGATTVFGSTTLTRSGSFFTDLFVAKLTDAGTSGSITWALGAGGTDIDNATSVAVAGANVYVSGNTGSTTSRFGTLTLTRPNTNGLTTGLVAKITDSGSSAAFVWGKFPASAFNEDVASVAVNGSSLYITGSFTGVASVGSTTLTSAGLTDIYAEKLTDAGSTATEVWAVQGGGGSFDYGQKLVLNGSIMYVAGTFKSPTMAWGTTTLTNIGTGSSPDLFVAKLTDAGSTGSLGWAVRAGSPEPAGTGTADGFSGLAGSGNAVYLSGQTSQMPATFGALTLTGNGSGATAFVARLTDGGSTGTFAWIQSVVCPSPNSSVSMTVAAGGGRVYLAGNAGSPATFSSITLTSPIGLLYYLASLLDGNATATTPAATWDGELQVLPNPARSYAVVQLPAIPGAATFTLLDALGRAVRTQVAATNARPELDLTGLAPGLYVVRVTAGGATAMRKLVVE